MAQRESPSRAMEALATLAPLTAAAVTTAGATYPIDVLRALSMSNAGSGKAFSPAAHWKSHGVKGFVSQGVLPELMKSTTMRVSKFFLFPLVCEGVFGVKPKDANPLTKGLAGALATVPEILMIAPMEVAKIGMQLDHENKFKNNSIKFVRHIYDTRGASGLWCGWAGMQWRQSFWTGTYFATLTSWKSAIEPMGDKLGVPGSITQFTAGFLAGTFAAIPNAPGDVVRSVVQKRMFEDPSRKVYGVGPGSVIEHLGVARDIVARSGPKALFSGFQFKALHMGASGAFMAMLVPMFSRLFGIGYGGV